MKLWARFLSVRYAFAAVFLGILVLGYAGLTRLPDVYESSATVAIERADDYVFEKESTDSEALSQRVHLVRSSVLRRENVLALLQEHGVLPPEATEEERLQAVARFRDAASIEFDNVSVVNPYTGKLGLLLLGLAIAYRDEDPERAFDLNSALLDDVLGGIRRSAAPVADQTEAFLSSELRTSLDRLAGIGERIADFKNRNSLYLPALYPVAVRRLDELDAQIERGRQDLAQLRRDRGTTVADLAMSSPEALMFSNDGTRIESPGERLEQLRIARASALAGYAPRHPEVVRLNREIEALSGYTGAGDTRALEVQLEQTQARQTTLRERYSPEHPDVLSAAREIARLQGALDAAADAPRESSTPSNPAYNRLLARQASIDEEVARETRRLEQLEERRAEVQEQLAGMPAVEEELAELMRLQGREEQAYAELERQLTASELGSNMRGADLLERFVVVEPPRTPLDPVAPRRKFLLALLTLFALCAATGAALLQLWRRDAIWDPEGLGELARGPVVLVPRFG